jgi:hypothetical protein
MEVKKEYRIPIGITKTPLPRFSFHSDSFTPRNDILPTNPESKVYQISYEIKHAQI